MTLCYIIIDAAALKIMYAYVSMVTIFEHIGTAIEALKIDPVLSTPALFTRTLQEFSRASRTKFARLSASSGKTSQKEDTSCSPVHCPRF